MFKLFYSLLGAIIINFLPGSALAQSVEITQKVIGEEVTSFYEDYDFMMDNVFSSDPMSVLSVQDRVHHSKLYFLNDYKWNQSEVGSWEHAGFTNTLLKSKTVLFNGRKLTRDTDKINVKWINREQGKIQHVCGSVSGTYDIEFRILRDLEAHKIPC